MSTKLIANIIIPLRITAETGLHIGTSNDDYEIGGMDNPIIRYFQKDTYESKGSYPYIPGSSLKGKMRSLMEWVEEKIDEKGQPHNCQKINCPVCRIFGSSAASNNKENSDAIKKRGPSRLIVRDLFPDEGTRKFMDSLEENEGLPKVEVKHENSLNRLTAEATPRPQERVPVGSRFEGELVYSIYSIDEAKNDDESAADGTLDIEYLGKVIEVLRLIEDSFLGGGGTRGSGKVKIEIATPALRLAEEYKNGLLTKKNNDWSSLPQDNKWVDDIKEKLFQNIKR
ncbi:type III-A CRISPR-associated RAMP protein Csm3 [bacterium]|nr:type III-A CRISPR-associated RAMP protein Csm3 [bacterium]